MHFMFTRAPGPACVNGCVCADPHAGHSGRRATASGGGFGLSGCSSDVTELPPRRRGPVVPPLSLLPWFPLSNVPPTDTLTNSAFGFNCLTRRRLDHEIDVERNREARASPGPLVRGTFSR
jgi:hypothetical protein